MTATLDPVAYEKEVVRPLRGVYGAIPRDLLTRYAVDLSMTEEQLRQRVDAVVALWNKKARSSSSASPVYRAFQQAHDELTRQREVRLYDPRWWRQQAGEWTGLVEKEVAALADEIRQLYGSVGFVLPGQIAGLDRLHPDLRGAGVRRALDMARIPTVEPEQLPQQSGLDRSSYERLTLTLEEAGAATIPHLVHPRVREVRLFRDPDAPGTALTRLDKSALEQRVQAVEAEANSARSRAATAALGILRTAAASGTDLRQLALFHILGQVRGTRTAGQPAMLTLRSLHDLGMARHDARVITASLLALEGASAAPAGPNDVRRLIAVGQLAEARRLAAALPARDPESDAAREVLAQAEARVNELITAARSALARGDKAEAARCAAEARSLASDDPVVTGFADAFPPPSPQDVAVVAEGLGVKLSWRPVPGDPAAIRYRVVRCGGRAPVAPGDGAVVAEGTETTIADALPPAAEPLSYGVFAASGRGGWSSPAVCTTEILPPVAEVATQVARDAVRCTWQMHSATTAVVIRRGRGQAPRGPRDGEPVRSDGTEFTDTGLSPGVTYCYAITAVYRDRGGREQLAAPVVVTATPQQEARPVASLRTELLPGDDESLPRARISWRQPEGAEVRILRAGAPCQWPFGTRVPAADVWSYGQEVTGEHTLRDGRAELTAELPWGHLVLTPFVFSGDSAIVGQDASLDITTAIGAVSYERRGPELLLSWAWPDRTSQADVRWRGPGGTGRRRVTRGERARDDGWMRIPVTEDALQVEVCAVEIGPPDVIASPRVIRVPAVGAALSYDIAWKPVLPGLTARECQVRVDALSGRHEATILAVAKTGVARPARADDGMVVAQARVKVSADLPAAFPVTVPKNIRKPYWLCCFLADGGEGTLIDPPVTHMKVG